VSRHAGDDRRWRRALARCLTRAMLSAVLIASALLHPPSASAAPPGALRIDSGRFTVIHYPGDAVLAAAALNAAVTRDSFPWLPRGTSHIVVMIAPDAAVFREWAGHASLPWTAALAFVEQHRIVMQGHSAGSDVGEPLQVLRHELAHVALYDYLGRLPPRWFDEGYASYAAGEERTQGFLSVNAALVFRGMPSLAALDTMMSGARGTDARAAYALSLRAVSDLAAIDRERGLSTFFDAWRERRSFDLATRRAFTLTAADFEAGWQRRTRWRFAFLSVAADGAIGTLVLLLLLAPAWRSRRVKQRARLDELRRRESITEQSARSAALDALMHHIGPGAPRSGPDA
jgi:uncharacterized membrane protein